MKKKDYLVNKSEKKEILYNLINAVLAGCLVLLGSFSSGDITIKGFAMAVLASLAVIITQFKSYWDGEKKEYSSSVKLFSFVK